MQLRANSFFSTWHCSQILRISKTSKSAAGLLPIVSLTHPNLLYQYRTWVLKPWCAPCSNRKVLLYYVHNTFRWQSYRFIYYEGACQWIRRQQLMILVEYWIGSWNLRDYNRILNQSFELFLKKEIQRILFLWHKYINYLIQIVLLSMVS